MMDVGRANLWFRSGFWARMRAAGCYPGGRGRHDRVPQVPAPWPAIPARDASAGGGVSAEQLTELLGDDLTGLPLDDWVLRWVDDVALPPTREAAPSDWA